MPTREQLHNGHAEAPSECALLQRDMVARLGVGGGRREATSKPAAGVGAEGRR